MTDRTRLSRRIRARYGHTVAGRVELPVADPPSVLFHGTGPRTADAVAPEFLTRRLER